MVAEMKMRTNMSIHLLITFTEYLPPNNGSSNKDVNILKDFTMCQSVYVSIESGRVVRGRIGSCVNKCTK